MGGSINIDLTPSGGISWPTCCAMCSGAAEAEAIASVSSSERFDYYVVALKWTQKTLSVSYPVCEKHRRLCNLLDLPARWGFINAFFYFLIVPSVLWIILCLAVSIGFNVKGDQLDPFAEGLGAILFGLMTVYYVSARMLKPVRLLGLHKDLLKLSIRNEDYFSRFAMLNRGAAANEKKRR